MNQNEKHDIDFLTSNVSISHSFGNVTAYVREKILGWFQQDFFKTVNVTTKMAFKNFDIFKNTEREFFRRSKPWLIIRPRWSTNDEDNFMHGTAFTKLLSQSMNPFENGALHPLLNDPRKDFMVKTMMSRERLYFDVAIVVETQYEQMDIANKLKYVEPYDTPILWTTHLETQIPKEIVAGVSYLSDIPMNCPAELLQYMNANSFYPITHRVKNASGVPEYFKMYETNIDSRIFNLEVDDGQKRGMIGDMYSVNFTISAEFWTSGAFHILAQNDSANTIRRMKLEYVDPDGFKLNPKQSALSLDIYHTSIDNVIDLPVGWQMLLDSRYKIKYNPPTPDVLDLDPYLDNKTKAVLKHHTDNNIPTDYLIKIFVFKDGCLMSDSKQEYVVNWKKKVLYTCKLNPDSEYKLTILTNNIYINRVLEDMWNK